MKLKNIIAMLMVLGMGSSVFAAGKAKKAETVKVDKAVTAKVEKADKILESAGIETPSNLDRVDAKLKQAKVKSKLSEAYAVLSKVVGDNLGTLKAQRNLQKRVNQTMSKVAEGLSNAEKEMVRAENSGKALSKGALEMVQVHQAIIKLTAEAIKTGDESSFDRIDEAQSVLEKVDLKDESSVKEARKAIEKIFDTDIKSVIDCL